MINAIKSILKGIDQTEIESPDGWWETSEGAKFGAKKLQFIIGLLNQAEKQEPVANGLPLVIAGAIFDFAGYLTTRDKVIEVGSTANASPITDLVKEWAALRGLSLEDAAVLSWQEWLIPVFTSDTSQERVDEAAKQRHDTTPPQRKPLTDEQIEDLYFDNFSVGQLKAFARAIEAAHGIKE